jgi:hydroxymethyl cephem carbamoyltransferase
LAPVWTRGITTRGRAKLEWDVYCGDPFIEDTHEAPDFERADLNLAEVCRLLQRGAVLGWVQGKYEIGPRALGNRSMIAAPFSEETRDRLNRIKMREGFRPIAPICLEEDFRTHFEGTWPSPHMLYFQRVKSPQLAGITHVDGSARAQSVNEAENPKMHALLREFRKQTGFGVLCNTSLNFKGRGFVNRSSQLFALARDRGFDGVVIGDHFLEASGVSVTVSGCGLETPVPLKNADCRDTYREQRRRDGQHGKCPLHRNVGRQDPAADPGCGH